MKAKITLIPRTSWTAKHIWSLETKPLIVLLITLAIMGIGEGLILQSNLGSAPWTVLSQGIALQGNFSVGWASAIISSIVMLLWLPLKMKAGIGTLLNIAVIALLLGLTVASLPTPTHLVWQLSYFFCGMLFLGGGTAFYLTCHLGAGPRDGLMVGLCKQFHLKIAVVRTALEVSVCLLGYWLGGTIGIGTLMFALGVGWIVQATLGWIQHHHSQ